MNSLNHSHAKALYLRFAAIYGDKFCKDYHDADFKAIWYNEWVEGLIGIDVAHIKGVLDHCKLSLEWPPSIAEFRKLCEKASGMPSWMDCLEASIRGDFKHPVAYLAYLKVGSWAMKNDKDEVLKRKYEAAYGEAITEFRTDPEKARLQLEERSASNPPLLDYKPTPQEIKGFKERLREYQEKAKADKETQGKMGHPIWEKDAIAVGGGKFSESIFNERKRYLLSLNEYEAGTLEREDWYDRTKYLRELEAIEHLKKVGYTGRPPTEHTKKPSGRGYVKDWMND